MSTETPSPKPIPRHIVAGVTCGFLAALMFILSLAYYIAAAAGILPTPPVGFAPIWSTLIAVLALVPINLWSAHCAVRPIAHEISEGRAEVRQALAQFGDKALQSAQEAGHWQGIVTELRNNPPHQDSTAAVVSIMSARRGGNGN